MTMARSMMRKDLKVEPKIDLKAPLNFCKICGKNDVPLIKVYYMRRKRFQCFDCIKKYFV